MLASDCAKLGSGSDHSHGHPATLTGRVRATVTAGDRTYTSMPRDACLCLGEGGQRVVGDRHAERRQAGERARILAERRRALALDRARQRAALGLGDGLDQHPAHPPGGADDDETHGSRS